MLLIYRPMLQNFFPARQRHQDSPELLSNHANGEHHALRLLILLPGSTMTSTTAYMNALSARTRFKETRRVGRAGHAGLSSTSVASRNGPLMRAPRLPVNRPREVIYRPHANGGVQVAIFHRTLFLRCLPVGARRKSILSRSQGCLPFPVETLAQEIA